MLKKTITYTNFNDVEVTEDFYFNLSKAELLESELKTAGGLEALLTKIINSKDQEEITETFKDIILRAYGEKSEDGKHFRKSPEIRRDFESTAAYVQLFVELATDTDAAVAFVNGILPKDENKVTPATIAAANAK